MTFNSYNLMAVDMTSSAAVTAFLGDSSSGGFLKAAADAIDAAVNNSSGLIDAEQTAVASEIQRLDARIATKQEEVDRLQDRLLRQMASADALIATMQQQYSYVSSMFDAMRTASESNG
jgi:flagellar capping protein FliD